MLSTVNFILWNFVVITLIIVTGGYLTVRSKFLQFRKLPAILLLPVKTLFSKNKNGVSPFAAMSTALAGTMGTGNIVGVGIAIVLGGPGAVFWMCVSSFLCMIIKYAEVYLAMCFREKDETGQWRGGPMYYIKNGTRNMYPLACLFCICTILATFGTGNATQSSVIAGSIESTFGIPKIFTGIIIAVLTAFVIFGSSQKLMSFTSYLLPFMTIFYFSGAIVVLYFNRANILPAIRLIISDAFRIDSAGAGFFGFLSAGAFRHGIAKGIFTNEAGMGSAPIAHAAADNTPENQGLWGAFEVFLDTTVMCTLTGIVIVSSGLLGKDMQGETLITDAFRDIFGTGGEWFIAVCILLFAFGALVSWSYYGAQCCSFLTRKKSAVSFYKFLYCVAVFVFSNLSVSSVFELSDLLNACMTVPNLIFILLLHKHIQ